MVYICCANNKTASGKTLNVFRLHSRLLEINTLSLSALKWHVNLFKAHFYTTEELGTGPKMHDGPRIFV